MTRSANHDSGRLRLGMIGAGWIARVHLDALDRLGRTRLVAVASARAERAEALAGPQGAAAYDDIERMLDEQRPDVVYVAVPPGDAITVLEPVVEHEIPFLAEKPLAATDPEGPARVADFVARRGIVAAVGYHLRALDGLADVRRALHGHPVQLVVARWLDATPSAPWWRRVSSGGGQVVEQATHFYDLARFLVGEATVVGAAATTAEPRPPGSDVVDATAAVLRFASGAVGSFANTRRLASSTVEIELAGADVLVTIRRSRAEPGGWAIDIDDGGPVRTIPPGRDPYERQAESFLDAVETHDPAGVLSSYADALETDRLTRAVVAATGRTG